LDFKAKTTQRSKTKQTLFNFFQFSSFYKKINNKLTIKLGGIIFFINFHVSMPRQDFDHVICLLVQLGGKMRESLYVKDEI
jgi:hypothetical protein